MILLVASAWSATLLVYPDGSGDFATIQAAVDAAEDYDTIELAAGTYMESVVIDGRGLSFDGAGAEVEGDPAFTLIDSSVAISGVSLNGTRGLVVDGGSVSLLDLTFEGLAGALDIDGSADVALRGATFRTNEALRGSAIRLRSGALSVATSTFEDNDAVYGASIYADSGTVELTENRFDREYASEGGGSIWLGEGVVLSDVRSVWADPYARDGGAVYAEGATALTFVGSRFVQPSAVGGSGGGVYATDVGALSFDAVNLLDATATLSGGGLLATMGDTASEVRITDTSIERAAAADAGALSVSGTQVEVWLTGVDVQESTGGVGFTAARLAIDGCTFWRNTGGALVVHGGETAILDSLFQDNNTTGSGGAARFVAGSLTVSGTTFRSNTADIDGGALMLEGLSALTVDANVFEGNDAPRASAAGNFDWVGGAEAWTYNVFVENRTASSLLLHGSVAAEVRNNHFVGERARDGALRLWEANADVRNNLFAFTAGNAVTADAASTATWAYNDWWANTADTADAVDLSVVSGPGSVQVDPQLRLWTNDEDFDAYDLRPADGSPIIDAGDPAFDDADGSRSDIGAYGATGPGGDDTGDTGDTGDTDSGAPDTDTDVHDADTGAPDTDVVPYDDGVALGDCGCGGAAAWALIAPLVLVVRRRR